MLRYTFDTDKSENKKFLFFYNFLFLKDGYKINYYTYYTYFNSFICLFICINN